MPSNPSIAIRACLIFGLAIPFLAGCLFESEFPRDPAPLSRKILGDSTGEGSGAEIAALSDTGAAVAWIRADRSKPHAKSIVLQRLDANGASRYLARHDFPDSTRISRPRLSAFPNGGFAGVWTAALPGQPDIAYLDIQEPLHQTASPVPLAFPEVARATEATVLALGDRGYVVGIAGFDSAKGAEGIWSCRFTAAGRPQGVFWSNFDSPAFYAPEFVALPDGGWMQFWSRWDASMKAVAWQRFDKDGEMAGGEGYLARPLLGAGSRIHAGAISGGRILVQLELAPATAFLITKEGTVDSAKVPAGFVYGGLVPDSAGHRTYSLHNGKLMRLDENFVEKAARSLPTTADVWYPDFRMSIDKAGRLWLVAPWGPDPSPVSQPYMTAFTLAPF